MKKKIFSIAAVVLFMSTNAFASINKTEEDISRYSCEDLAWDVMEYVYDQEGDGFLAAEAMDYVLAHCVD
ncbi:hypothetical protein [Cellulophaga lytica]|uniref:Secreted protein n=1 Tax=Cellulophaga lytica (strain ATCC 23178 / DSM 7489 / JCM 8516 / NBRC 14961 / NCIMB 1423 / VKM B-1433 / Cy l20) TaxID=867900 RepID=F0RBE4_CELLC|nr:hypothetical protein [Cellulophaga lytica]ADY29566.1 hypothetical protein Celly_1742 [Cellulophaga lytica DSM 7489]AIM60573.1 hypothetical protein IX49_08575 [Cellulophaga lytica]WQG76263.1 hypothetical protein SR888_11280 [Cellulophaga lytica]